MLFLSLFVWLFATSGTEHFEAFLYYINCISLVGFGQFNDFDPIVCW